ncbi:MAG: MATE family efflux transporter [Candidatus Hydrogenedens sp.]|nr:MATE family efflux transporter [Candidatus Hydrogenedens sp.]
MSNNYNENVKNPFSWWDSVHEVFFMSWPIVLGSLSYTVMEFCDKWMVSRLGTIPLAAVGSAGIWSYTLSTLLLGIVGCSGTFVAQSYGRQQWKDCSRYTWQGIYLALGSILLAGILGLISEPLFLLMKHSPEVTRQELIYFRIRLLGYPPMAMGSALASFFPSISKPRIPMYSAILGNILNLLLNYLLIFGKFGFPRLEIAGASLATIISQWVQTLFLFILFIQPSIHRTYRTRTYRRFDYRRMKELIRIGIPAGLSMFLDICNWSIFTSFIIGRFGAVPLAAHNIAISFMHLCFMPAVAVSIGISAIVGQWLGRKQIRVARQRVYVAIFLCIVYMASMGLVFAIFGGKLIAFIFSKDTEVIHFGHQLLILAALFQAFDAINIVCLGALRGAGDTKWVMWAMVLNAYGFFLPLSIITGFVLGWGALGSWISATIYIFVLSITLLYRFISGKWSTIVIFSENNASS